jgi:serine/threonine-protein kinase RsbW
VEPTTLDGPIELTLPADSRMLRLVRLVASGLASTIGLDVDELDDLRIAVDEAVAALLEGGDGSRLAVRFELDADTVTMAGSAPSGDTPLDPERLDLSTQLLGAVCDEHRMEVVDGRIHVGFTKRRSAAA